MPRVTTRTHYSAIFPVSGGSLLGDFVLRRIYRFGTSAIVFHNLNNDRIYPWEHIWSATIST